MRRSHDRRVLLAAAGLLCLGLAAAALALLWPYRSAWMRWWQRRPTLTLEAVDPTATPLMPDEAAWRPQATRPPALEVHLWAPETEVRALARFGPWIAAGTQGGLLLLDRRHIHEDEGCWVIPEGALRRLGPESGLPDLRVEALLVEEGRLWVGTRAGVASLEIEGGVVHAVEQLRAPRVSSLARWSGRLWVGTHDRGLYQRRGRRLEPVAGLPREIAALAPTRQGLLVATPEGLYRLRDGVSERLHAGWFEALATDASGHTYAAGISGLFDVGEAVAPVSSLGGVPLRALAFDGRRLLAAGWDGKTRQIPSGRRLDGPTGLRAALALPDGALLLGTREGLYLHDRAGHWHLLGREGLPSGDVVALAAGDGRIFAGTFRDGLAVLEAAPPRSSPAGDPWGGGKGPGLGQPVHFRRLGDLGRLEINALARDGETLWVGSSEGLYRLEGTTLRRFGRRDGLASDHVTALAVGAGALWVGTGRGVSRIELGRSRDPSPGPGREPPTVRTFRRRHGLPAEQIFAIATVGDEAWVGTLHGLARLDARGVKEVITPADGRLPDGWITAVEAAEDGSVWIGTYDAGLVHVTASDRGWRWQRVDTGIGGPRARIQTGALATSGERVFAGTRGGGLVVIEGTRMWTVGRAQGLPSNEVRDVVVSPAGLWIATDAGVALLRPTPLDAPKKEDRG